MWVANSFGTDEIKSLIPGAAPPANAELVSGKLSLWCASVNDRICRGAAGGSSGLAPNKPPVAVQVAPLAGTDHYKVTVTLDDGTKAVVEVAPDNHDYYGWSAVVTPMP